MFPVFAKRNLWALAAGLLLLAIPGSSSAADNATAKGGSLTTRTGDGRFTFRTIRPASYPNSQIAQHVHLHIEGPGVARRWTTELQFEDDPKITAQQRSVSRAAGLFGGVRPVAKRSGVDHVEINLKIEDRGRF